MYSNSTSTFFENYRTKILPSSFVLHLVRRQLSPKVYAYLLRLCGIRGYNSYILT
jgi:hypothetical protein